MWPRSWASATSVFTSCARDRSSTSTASPGGYDAANKSRLERFTLSRAPGLAGGGDYSPWRMALSVSMTYTSRRPLPQMARRSERDPLATGMNASRSERPCRSVPLSPTA